MGLGRKTFNLFHDLSVKPWRLGCGSYRAAISSSACQNIFWPRAAIVSSGPGVSLLYASKLPCFSHAQQGNQAFLFTSSRCAAQCANEKEKPLYYSEQVKWSPIFPERKDKVDYAMKLAKFRLTGLVVLTTLAGYVVAPGDLHLLPCLSTMVGTALCSASANAFNQFLEIPYDSQMSRTRNRVLVQGLVRPLEAFLLGTLSGIAGITLLYASVNTPTALLGLANILLYAMLYTPSKRLSIANTWIGAVVGSIPPVMGWAACTGHIDFGALALALLLYCWQFPHFNALSWSYRPDYSRAGYRMMAVTDPALCRRVTLRHGLALVPLALLFPLLKITTWWFVFLATPVNIIFAQLSFRFYQSSDNKSARKLFRFSLLNLPILILLMIVSLERKDSSSEVGPLQLRAVVPS